MLTHGIRTLLLHQPEIVSLAPSQTVNRRSTPVVFCDNAPQGVKPPYVVIHAMGTDPMLTMDTYDESLKSDDIDIDVVAYSIPQARALSETIRQYFDDYRGVFATGTDKDSAREVDGSHGKYLIVGHANSLNGIVFAPFIQTYYVANISQSESMFVYLEDGASINGDPVDTPLTLDANTVATITSVNVPLKTYSATTSTTNVPADVVHAVLWEDENYTYDYPSEGRDAKYHIITTSYQIQSEQGT